MKSKKRLFKKIFSRANSQANLGGVIPAAAAGIQKKQLQKIRIILTQIRASSGDVANTDETAVSKIERGDARKDDGGRG